MTGKHSLGVRLCVLLAMAAVLFLAVGLQAQETTGGLQGTVKDAAGAVVPNALVELTGSALIGSKTINTDATGYYRFTNLSPGSYTVTVKVQGFDTLKREGITIEVGHLPTLDLALKVGSQSTVVEVTAEAPLIDLTTTHTTTNVTQDVIQDVPHGYSFQSVIQFAPSARNEPLQGLAAGPGINGTPNGGTGGTLPGSSGNGLSFGYSVAGAADSENTYLIEGQDTENISAGYSNANVPFQFIQEVQVKSSGIEAEHGGAIGGVVNVIMKKGSNDWHGELFSSYESSGFDAFPDQYLRYDPLSTSSGRTDFASQQYQPTKDHFRILQPGGTIGGPIMKDRIWFFAGFAPLYTGRTRNVNFSAPDSLTPTAGIQNFSQNTQQYYGNARVDAVVTQKVRVFGSWLTQQTRRQGLLPIADSTQGYFNIGTSLPLTAYSPGLGFSAPNTLFNTGADITITPRIVSTTRYGYFFQNYHDFGWPTQGVNLDWFTGGVGGTDVFGAPLPATLQMTGGTETAFAYKQQYTVFNAGKHYQFDQDVAIFKSGWWGTHNFKFGYQYNHLNLDINQNGNVPLFYLFPSLPYSPLSSTGVAACATLTATYGQCSGQYGWGMINDFATIGSATDSNYGLFAQDSWTLGHGVTVNLGIRIEKETLPPPPNQGNFNNHTINFGWGDKVAPRIGAAWDVYRNGKMKLFGSYGVTNDIMKLLLAETSWGGQVFEECVYGISPNAQGTFTPSQIDPVYINGRACPSGPSNTPGNFANGQTPSGLTFIENSNLRPLEPVAPGVNPYRQHETTFGIDYALGKNWALEARWDRRRLDHILEDASLSDVANGELYTIVNPGQGVNRTLNGYSAYLGSLGQVFGEPGVSFNSATFGTCPACPLNPTAQRSYDGVEFRLTKALSQHYSGMFSYTYSKLRGNYTGLTTSEQTDGGVPGRDSPDTSRSFDEPYFYFNQAGGSSNGLLPTDRPNTFKGYGYYTLPEGKRNVTTFGLLQYAYQGAPQSTFIDVGGSFPQQPGYAMYIVDRGKWADATVDSLGNITLGAPYTRRAPWFVQSDLQLSHELKVNKNNERQVLGFSMNVTNLFNQRAITSYFGSLNSFQVGTALYPGIGLAGSGAAAYNVFEHGFSPAAFINTAVTLPNGSVQPPVTYSSWYGQPFTYQLTRSMFLAIHYSF